MKVLDIAIEVFGELDEPEDISVALISLWLRENIGAMNNLASTSFVIDSTTHEISPEPTEDEKSILKQFYLVYFYDRKLRSVLSSADSNSVVEISEGGATIRMLNKNEMAKTYITAKKEEQNNLKNLIFNYKMNNSAPTQVSGKDTIEGIYAGDENTRNR